MHISEHRNRQIAIFAHSFFKNVHNLKATLQPGKSVVFIQPETGLLILAFAVIYLVWGASYLANWWAVRAIPPFLLAGFRFTSAGLLMLLFLRGMSPQSVTRKQLFNCFFAGFFLFVVGNGAVVWALQHIYSGIAALIIALQPLVVVFFQWTMRGEKPSLKTLLGIALGIWGVALLVGQPEYLGDRQWMLGLVGVFAAMIAWGYISVWMPKADLPSSSFQSAALQLLGGGLMLLLVGAFTGDYARLDVSQINGRVVWSMLFLIFGASILAFTSFNYLLKRVSPEKVVTNTYVNPVVALLLGWWLNQEALSLQSVWASVILLCGVILINTRVRRRG